MKSKTAKRLEGIVPDEIKQKVNDFADKQVSLSDYWIDWDEFHNHDEWMKERTKLRF